MLILIYMTRRVTEKDVKADFTVRMPDKDDITMALWMKGEKDREVFSALSPMTEGLSRIKDMPYVIADQPTLTFVARQRGEAWNRPFVAVYEPHTLREPSRIGRVTFPEVEGEGKAGVKVELVDGNTDFILSSDKADEAMEMEGVKSSSVCSVVRKDKKNGLQMCFMGGGTSLQVDNLSISSGVSSDVLLVKKHGVWMYTASAPVSVVLEGRSYHLPSSLVLKTLE